MIGFAIAMLLLPANSSPTASSGWIAAAVVAWRFAVSAERQSLETIARPLAFVE